MTKCTLHTAWKFQRKCKNTNFYLDQMHQTDQIHLRMKTSCYFLYSGSLITVQTISNAWFEVETELTYNNVYAYVYFTSRWYLFICK